MLYQQWVSTLDVGHLVTISISIPVTFGFVLALHDLGVCLSEQNKLEEAERCLRKAIDIEREKLDYQGISSAQSKTGHCLVLLNVDCPFSCILIVRINWSISSNAVN